MNYPEPPRVFLSYSWDSEEYKSWVESLATRLRQDGIDARLDVWHLKGMTVPEFMNREVRKADKVLVLCSPGMRRKVHRMEDGGGSTGVGWEAMLLTNLMFSGLRGRNKGIALLTLGTWNESAPDFLIGQVYVDLSNPERFEERYRGLLQRITEQIRQAPKLGEMPADLEDEAAMPLAGAGTPPEVSPRVDSPTKPAGPLGSPTLLARYLTGGGFAHLARRGILGVALLAMAWTAWFYLRGHVSARQQLLPAESAKVAVLEFADSDGDPESAWLAVALGELLRFEFEETLDLGLVSVAEQKWIEEMPASGNPFRDIGPKTLQQIQHQTGADAVVSGEIRRTGEGRRESFEVAWYLRSTYVDPQSSVSPRLDLTSEKGDLLDVPGLVARLSAGFRHSLDLSARPPGLRSLEQSLPRQAEAIELYAASLEKLRGLDSSAARELLERALEIEPENPFLRSALAGALVDLENTEQAEMQARTVLEQSRDLEQRSRYYFLSRYLEAEHRWSQAAAVLKCLWIAGEERWAKQVTPVAWLDDGLRLVSLQARAHLGKEAGATLEVLRRFSTDPRVALAEAEVAQSLSEPARQRLSAAKAAAEGARLGLPLVVARAHYLEGQALRSLARLDQAEQRFHEAAEIYGREGNGPAEARTHLALGYVSWVRRDFIAAKASYDEADRIYTSIDNKAGIAKVQVNKGWLLQQQGDLDAAIDIYRQALELIREIGDRETEAHTLINLSGNLEKRGHLSEALAAAQSALEIVQEQGGGIKEPMILAALGALQGQSGLLRKARITLERALALFQRAGDKLGEAEVSDHLAGVLFHQGELAAAKRTFEELLSLHEESGNWIDHAKALRGLGGVLLAEGELDGARELFRQAEEAQSRSLSREDAAKIQLSQARLAVAEAELGEAEAVARNAAEGFRRSGNALQEALARAVLAEVFLMVEKAAEAREQIEIARRLLGETPSPVFKIPVEIVAARQLAARGDAELARSGLEALLATATAGGFVALELETRLALGRIDVDLGSGPAGAIRLDSVEREARAKGFGLIAGKAAQ